MVPRKGLRWCVLAVLALALVGCSGSGEVLGPNDNGTVVEAAVGDQLVVELPSNPSTGYAWQVADAGPCDAPEASTFVQDADTAEMTGSGGIERFMFMRTSSGAGSITLEYRRPWEDASLPAEDAWSVQLGAAVE